MKTIFTNKEVDEIILGALANGGLTELYYSGIEVNPDKSVYKQQKSDDDCYESVLLKYIKKKGLPFCDVENDSEYNAVLNYDKAKKVLSENKEAAGYGRTILDGVDDAWTGYNLIQLFLYDEVIFG